MAEIDNRYAQRGFGARADVAVDEGLRAYMLRVYNYMALGVAGTAIVTLFLMNNPLVTQQAELWSQRVLALPNMSNEQRITRLYLTAFSRPPEPNEMADSRSSTRNVPL